MRKGEVLAVLAIYSPGHNHRKKKTMHAMLALAVAPEVGAAAAILRVWCRILSGMGRT